MRHHLRAACRVVLSVLLTASAATSAGVSAAAADAPDRSESPLRAACAPAHGPTATCFAQFRIKTSGRRIVSAPTLTPADIAAAYRLPSSAGSRATVAIVDAYDNPHAEDDLAVYRTRFKLPPCTTANGCFRKVNQRGAAAPLPDGDSGWGLEISLDLDAVSAACPSCRIVLVEGDSADLTDLGTSVDTAVRLGAVAVSNSYGATENNGSAKMAANHYRHPGVAVVASSGDDGYVVPSFPAVASSVIAVGGTSLTKAPGSARGWTEQAWSDAGSGCSGYVAKPAWQRDGHCPTRTVADISAVADPDSGFVVRDTYDSGADTGYLSAGGTSLSAPLIAAMIARAGNAGHLATAAPIYAKPSAFFDVVGGSTGYCGDDYLCTGVNGYDAPTGVGSPNGLGGL